MMDIIIITKILGNNLIEDIIREISTYFIQKINDSRLDYMEYTLFYKNPHFFTSVLDGEFYYNLVKFNETRYFLLRSFPKLFIEYHFCIDGRITSIRFWLKDNICEVPIDGVWVKYKI